MKVYCYPSGFLDDARTVSPNVAYDLSFVEVGARFSFCGVLGYR